MEELKPGDIAITIQGTKVAIVCVGVDWCKAVILEGINKGMEVEIKRDRLARFEKKQIAIPNPFADRTGNSYLLCIERVIFNPPATIVLWKDGTKTVVKVHNEEFDKEKGLAMAILRSEYGAGIRKLFRKWCGDDKDEN